MSDKDKYEASALAILQDEIDKLRKKRERALYRGHSRIVNELNSQIGILERIVDRFVKEIA